MSRSVPTLLGIMIILMVVMLVLLIYDYRLTSGLASGAAVVGTVGGQLLTGVDQPDEQIAQSRTIVRTRAGARPVSAAKAQRGHGTLRPEMDARQRPTHRRGRAPGDRENPRSPRGPHVETHRPGA